MKVPSNIPGALLRWLLLSGLAITPAVSGLAEEPKESSPLTEDKPPPVDPTADDEVPEEMVEFLLMMDLLDDYGDAIDVEVEMDDQEEKN